MYRYRKMCVYTDPFSEKSAGDEESDVDGGAAHEDAVKSFRKFAARHC